MLLLIDKRVDKLAVVEKGLTRTHYIMMPNFSHKSDCTKKVLVEIVGFCSFHVLLVIASHQQFTKLFYSYVFTTWTVRLIFWNLFLEYQAYLFFVVVGHLLYTSKRILAVSITYSKVCKTSSHDGIDFNEGTVHCAPFWKNSSFLTTSFLVMHI